MENDGANFDINAIKAEVVGFRDDTRGWNVFHFAAHHQSDSIMEKLVEFIGKIARKIVCWCKYDTFIAAKADIVNERSKDHEQATALHLAVKGDSDNDGLVSTLLQHLKIDTNIQDAEKWSPLHHACQRGFSKSVLALHCADFCCLDNEGDSPLHLAASYQPVHSDLYCPFRV